jgi:uncharacterized DUF497 family protein
MEIGYDPAKNDWNIANRGISFMAFPAVLAGLVAEFRDTRIEYGEVRINVYGTVEGRLYAATYTMRGSVYWVISLRKANAREQAKWL